MIIIREQRCLNCRIELGLGLVSSFASKSYGSSMRSMAAKEAKKLDQSIVDLVTKMFTLF